MKKSLLVSLLVASSLLVVGCGQKTTPTSGTQANNTPKNVAQPKEVVKEEAPMVIETGDSVKINYIGRSEKAGLFDTNIEEIAKEEGIYIEQRPYTPLEFTVGNGNMIPGMEKGVLGMKKGEVKTLVIQADEAYGQYRDDLIQEIEKAQFDTAGIDPKVGDSYNFGIAQGTVLKVEEEMITLDFNHELAGQALTFEVTIVDVIKNAGDEEEVLPDSIDELDVVVE